MKSFKLNLLAATLAAVAVSTPIATFAAPPLQAPSPDIAAPGGFGAGNGSDGLDLEVAAKTLSTPKSHLSAPVEIPNNFELTYEDLLQRWTGGEPMSAQLLSGTWRFVAGFEHEFCHFKAGVNGADLSGLKNRDGSLFKLQFRSITKPANPFGSSKPEQVFAVELHNLGSQGMNQGPYIVNPVEPRFSQWGYEWRPQKQSSDYYIEYNCRGLHGDPGKMICASQIKMMNPDGFSSSDMKCANTSNGLMFGFIKESSD
jgi:hypothetical protein